MLIYIVNIILLLIWMMIENLNKKNGKLFLKFSVLQIFLIAVLKSKYVGTDTISYIKGFEKIKELPIEVCFDLSKQNIVFNFERGFIFLSKCISLINDNIQIYFTILYLIIFIPLYMFIKKHSESKIMSIILYITLNFYAFSLSGIRQTIAFSFIFFSYDYLIERKFIKFLFIIIIASFFHSSALFFIPAYLLFSIELSTIFVIVYCMILLAVFFMRKFIFSYVLLILKPEGQVVETGAITLFIIVFLVFILSMFYYKKIIKSEPDKKIVFNIIAVAAGLMVFNSVYDIAMRVTNYYYLFMIIFIPMIVKYIDDYWTKILTKYIIIGFNIVYYLNVGVYFLGCVPYYFFWD